jgi:hypothetical protein
MVFTTAGGGANQLDTGYNIDNSLRFNDGDSPSLSRTPSSAGNRKIWTWSGWVKRSTLGTFQFIFDATVDTNDATDNQDRLYFSDSNYLIYQRLYDAGTTTTFQTNRVFRDVSAWYHIVLALDTTDATSTNRVKIYVNGEEITSFSTSDYPPQNYETEINNNVAHYLGNRGLTSSLYFDGYLAETYFIDGQQLAPTDFGETNENGVWIPKAYEGSYGTNGFFLEFKQTGTSQNSSGMGADTSGNDHHFAVSNLAATDVTTDTPTNNFATLNPLAVSRFSSGNAAVFAEGNLQIATQTSDNDRVFSVASMGVTSGKWYWEIKAVVASKCDTGVCDANTVLGYSQHFNNETSPPAISVNPAGNIYGKGGEDYDDHLDWAPDLVNNDIIMWALDMDNYELWHGINGTWSDSGDPTSGATGTGGIVNESGNAYRTNLNHGEPMFPFVQDASTGGQMKAEFNFGNAPFTISSGNADANGYGNFEYAVPSGYYALCTKNLAEYG